MNFYHIHWDQLLANAFLSVTEKSQQAVLVKEVHI